MTERRLSQDQVIFNEVHKCFNPALRTRHALVLGKGPSQVCMHFRVGFFFPLLRYELAPFLLGRYREAFIYVVLTVNNLSLFCFCSFSRPKGCQEAWNIPCDTFLVYKNVGTLRLRIINAPSLRIRLLHRAHSIPSLLLRTAYVDSATIVLLLYFVVCWAVLSVRRDKSVCLLRAEMFSLCQLDDFLYFISVLFWFCSTCASRFSSYSQCWWLFLWSRGEQAEIYRMW